MPRVWFLLGARRGECKGEIAELYGSSLQKVQQTIARVLADSEVNEPTINSELIVRTDGTPAGVRREVKVYNLDMVLAVGYRSTSPRVVQFRQWATGVPREHLVKGFAMDDDKLRASDGWDYLNHSPPHRSGSFNPLLSR